MNFPCGWHFLLYIFWGSVVRCLPVPNCYTFFYCSFSRYVVPLLTPINSFLPWNQYYHVGFSLVSTYWHSTFYCLISSLSVLLLKGSPHHQVWWSSFGKQLALSVCKLVGMKVAESVLGNPHTQVWNLPPLSTSCGHCTHSLTSCGLSYPSVKWDDSGT